MDFLEKNIKTIALALIGFIVVGLVLALVSQHSDKKEIALQEKYFLIEDKAKKLREFLNKKDEAKTDTAKPPFEPEALKSELISFIDLNKGTVSAQMATLELVQLIDQNIITVQDKNSEKLKLLQGNESNSDYLTNSLVRMRLAQELSDQNKCSEALVIYEKVIKNKKNSYLHAEAQLSQALCYKKLNELQKAEDLLIQVKNLKTEDSGHAVQEADRILRLIQFNKSFGT